MGNPLKGATPPTWKLMLVKWLGLYPILVIVSYVFEWIKIEPLWFKLICTTAILVPTLAYVITPLMDSLFSSWLYRGIDKDAQQQSIDIGS